MSPLHRPKMLALVVALGVAVASAAPASAQPDKTTPNLVALTVGVSQHQAAGSNLRYAAKDARDLAVALRAQEGQLFERVLVRTLTDTTATRDNIEESLEWLAKQVKPEDYVMVFVSGHGSIDSLGHYCFIPHDYQPMQPRTAVRWSVFRDTLARLPGKRFLVLDTCRAGGAGGDGLPAVSPASILSGLAHKSGLITYASCMAGESSFEPRQGAAIQNGYFTCALLEALGGKADTNGDGVMTLAEVDAYVANRVKALSHGQQNPTMQRPETIPSSLALALAGAAGFASSMPLASMPLVETNPQTSEAPVTGPIAPGGSGPQESPDTGPIRPEREASTPTRGWFRMAVESEFKTSRAVAYSAPLSPVLGGEGLGVRGSSIPRSDVASPRGIPSPLTPTPLPPITGGEGKGASQALNGGLSAGGLSGGNPSGSFARAERQSQTSQQPVAGQVPPPRI